MTQRAPGRGWGYEARDRNRNRDRGQLVLVAAAFVALALVPMAFAHVQLDHDPAADAPATVDADELRTAVDEAADAAAANVSGRASWSERTAAVSSANATLRAELARMTAAHADRDILVTVAANGAAADRWAAKRCPSGEMRRFGGCEGRGGFVVQERAGEVHVVGVAVTVRVHAPSETATYGFEVRTP